METAELSWLTNLEYTERVHPEVLTEEDYARMMLAYIDNRPPTPMDVKYLWKRAPAPLKTSSILQTLANVAVSMDEKLFSSVYALLGSIVWPESLSSFATDVGERLRDLSLDHIQQVYDVISLDRFAMILGFGGSLDIAARYAQDAGCEVNSATQMVVIPSVFTQKTGAEEPWEAELDSLEMIGNTVWSLGKAPFIVSENIK